MKAVVTGASSGIGAELAKGLSNLGYFVVLVARRRERLESLRAELKDAEVYCADLSDENECIRLFERHKDASLIVNNAGIGVFGEFCETELETELDMLNLNIRSVHILTKLFLKEFLRRDEGIILNVASSAAFFPGPVFSSYYASKSYVYRLSEGIYEELKSRGSNVKISVLCPGPVKTEFNKAMGIKDGFGAKSAEFVADAALKNLGKRIIVPGFFTKCTRLFSKLIPDRLSAKINCKLQKNKII